MTIAAATTRGHSWTTEIPATAVAAAAKTETPPDDDSPVDRTASVATSAAWAFDPESTHTGAACREAACNGSRERAAIERCAATRPAPTASPGSSPAAVCVVRARNGATKDQVPTVHRWCAKPSFEGRSRGPIRRETLQALPTNPGRRRMM